MKSASKGEFRPSLVSTVRAVDLHSIPMQITAEEASGEFYAVRVFTAALSPAAAR